MPSARRWLFQRDFREKKKNEAVGRFRKMERWQPFKGRDAPEADKVSQKGPRGKEKEGKVLKKSTF